MEAWNITDLECQGNLLHQTWCSLLNAASALFLLNFNATLGGVVQDMCDLRGLGFGVWGLGFGV